MGTSLQENMITIEHKTGESHRNADALSRCFMQHQPELSKSEEDAETMMLEDHLRLYGAGQALGMTVRLLLFLRQPTPYKQRLNK